MLCASLGYRGYRDMTEYDKWMLLLSWLDSDNEDMFEDELVEIIAN